MAFRICAMLCLLFISAKAAPSGLSEQFKKCQATYDVLIGHLAENAGAEATAGVWRFLFYDMDLDGNEQLTAPEIALYLEKEHYVHETDIMEIMMQSSRWLAVADGGDNQLSREEFVKAVQKTVGEKNDPTVSAKYEDVATCMCAVFTLKVPTLTEKMKDLSLCTDSLEQAIMEDISERAEFNSWSAIFRTMDRNENKVIDFEELKEVIADHLSEQDDVAVASALGHAIYGEIHHDVQDMTEKHFYVFVHELLYGLKPTMRKEAWEDVVSAKELRGRTIVCKSISKVRLSLTKKRDLMNDCIRAYQTTKQSVLGADGVFAPEIVFTMADLDKNGEISQEEFDHFIGSSSELYGAIQRSHVEKGIKIKDFRSIMPDEIVVAKERGDFSAVLESSALTAPELGDAEKLCSAIIDAVQKYPTDDKPSEEHHNIHFPSSGMSFLSQGEHILVAHPFPNEEDQGETPTAETTDQPPSNADGDGVVYHIMGSNGVPFEFSLSHAEVDDISHRIIVDQEPPKEPAHGESQAGETPSTPVGKTPAESGDRSYSEEEEQRMLIEEIQKLIHIKSHEEQEAAEHGSDVTEAPTASQTPPVTPQSTENELEGLIQAIEESKKSEEGKRRLTRS